MATTSFFISYLFIVRSGQKDILYSEWNANPIIPSYSEYPLSKVGHLKDESV
jgi:hypothetical protein